MNPSINSKPHVFPAYRSLWAVWCALFLLLAVSVAAGADTRRLPGELRAGQLLVAKPHLSDPRFSRSVVLLVDAGPSGAWGVVVNKPTPVRLREVYPELASAPNAGEPLYWGGPVSPEQRLILVRASALPSPRALRLAPELFLSGSRTLLAALLDEAGDARSFRVVGGYAGWAPGQLEAEYGQGDWFTLPASAALIFDSAPGQLWEQLMPGRLMQVAAASP